MNKHIEQYLDSYLKKENTEYAILLTGNWGVGKTYFINRYIENKKTDEPKYKIIYISLFGLKTISEINDEIFEELHPMLSHKGVKFLGGVLRSAVKFGFNFDLVGDGSQETKLNIDLSKTKFFNKDNYENIVFVFDDLERTRIQMPEVLGFINNLCERENLKVIVITDEEKLSNDEYYKNFKEKVIGKSFTISQDNDEFWQDFSNRYKEKLHLNENITTIIKDTFSQHGNGNYRNLNRTTDSYIDFIENIDKKYLKNNNFYTLLTNEFYTLSIRYREKSDISKAFIPIKSGFLP